MKILIFGATGSIGTQLVEQALEEGYEVTAFVREPAKLGFEHPNLSFAQGDVLDPASVERAVPDHDAIMIALGAGARGGIRAEGTANIVQAAKSHKVERLVCLSTLGVGDSRPNVPFLWKHLMFGFILRKAYADHTAQEKIVKASGVDWTIVRPGGFTNGPLTKQYQHGFSNQQKGLASRISRRDLAHFMLQQLKDEMYLHKTPGISY